MAGQARSVLRGIARLRMRDLERDSLGIFAEGRLRDTFRLDPDLPTTHLLTTRPSQRNFIRSEDGSLLFRDAAPSLVDALGDRVITLSKAESQKGLEFLWSRLDEASLHHLFAAVESLARYPNRVDLGAGFVLPEEVNPPAQLVEGSVSQVTVNAYERNPEARRQCIAAHGTTCCICHFSFGQAYGPEAEGYIHVHHIRPLSEIGGAYVVDPVQDLRPVCPNCHAVLHLGGRCRTIDEVRQLRAQQRHA